MRDPKRIDRILGEIKRYWDAHPDERFFQVLTNMGWYRPDAGDQYEQEDSTLI